MVHPNVLAKLGVKRGVKLAFQVPAERLDQILSVVPNEDFTYGRTPYVTFLVVV